MKMERERKGDLNLGMDGGFLCCHFFNPVKDKKNTWNTPIPLIECNAPYCHFSPIFKRKSSGFKSAGWYWSKRFAASHNTRKTTREKLFWSCIYLMYPDVKLPRIYLTMFISFLSRKTALVVCSNTLKLATFSFSAKVGNSETFRKRVWTSEFWTGV